MLITVPAFLQASSSSSFHLSFLFSSAYSIEDRKADKLLVQDLRGMSHKFQVRHVLQGTDDKFAAS